jgi:eukaryotic-like serine/threonine-protein kinase
MLDLRLLGGCALERDGAPLAGPAAQRRRLALLALVARSGGGGISRERLMASLWPESDEDSARNLLKQAIFVLRRELGPDVLLGLAELRLNPERIRSDAGEFERLLDQGRPEEALTLYRGGFLDGFHLGHDAEAFERWADAERAELTGRYLSALEGLAGAAERGGDTAAAVVWWRRLAFAEPLSARYIRGLMEAFAAAGDPEAAVRQFRVHEALVRGELDAPADPALADLAGRLARAARTTESATAPVAEPAARPADLPPTPPPHPTPGRRRWLLLAGACALAAATYLLTVFPVRRAEPVLDPALLAVAPFGVFDPELDLWREGLVDVLSRELDGAGPLRTVSPSVVLRQWRGVSDPESAARLGRATGARTVLVGTLVGAGEDSVRLAATLVDAQTGAVMADLDRRDATSRMDRLTDSVALAVMRELGSELPGSAMPRSGLAAGSMEALKLFLRGEQFFRRTRWDSARVQYEKAVARDTGFALAFHRLGAVLGWERVSYDSLASVYLLRAGALNHGLSPRDSLLLRADSLTAAENLTDDALISWKVIRQLFETLTAAATRYPEDPEVWFALGEARYHLGAGPVVSVGYGSALEAFDRAIALDSGFAPAYLHPVELGFTLDGRELGLRYARAYLALQPTDAAHRGVRLVEQLVSAGSDAAAVRALLDTSGADVLVAARTRLRRWPDRGETAVMLSRLLLDGRPAGYQLFADSALMRRRLAEALAYRGHLHEAARVLGEQQFGIFVDLAYLDAVPAGAARAAFGRWLTEDAPSTRWAIAWWSAHGDSAEIGRFAARARARLAAATTPAERVLAEYDTAATGAHLTLLRGDTTGALRRFEALPDSACIRCYLDRLTRARLLVAWRRDREAVSVLSERLVPFLTPIEPVFMLERGRAAARLGDQRSAAAAFDHVARIWRNGDPELLALVRRVRADARAPSELEPERRPPAR